MVGHEAFSDLLTYLGYPQFDVDYGKGNFPQEASLGDHISFNKGCYVGQEIISRLESVGQVNRILVGLSFDPETVPAPGWSLCDEKNNEVGTVTSVSNDKGAVLGLGYMKRNHCPVQANNVEKTLQSSVKIRDTPFINS